VKDPQDEFSTNLINSRCYAVRFTAGARRFSAELIGKKRRIMNEIAEDGNYLRKAKSPKARMNEAEILSIHREESWGMGG
jgi:hypothetical protein